MYKILGNLRLTVIYFALILRNFSSVFAQDLESRAYTNIPRGFNLVLAGYSYSQGGLVFDPAIPLGIHHALKLNLSTGVSTRTGSDYDVAGLIWQYRWGKGLPKSKRPD